eukprot:366539-Chlamydomonas_euryale.AAC.9
MQFTPSRLMWQRAPHRTSHPCSVQRHGKLAQYCNSPCPPRPATRRCPRPPFPPPLAADR